MNKRCVDFKIDIREHSFPPQKCTSLPLHGGWCPPKHGPWVGASALVCSKVCNLSCNCLSVCGFQFALLYHVYYVIKSHFLVFLRNLHPLIHIMNQLAVARPLRCPSSNVVHMILMLQLPLAYALTQSFRHEPPLWPRFLTSNRFTYGHGRAAILRPLRNCAWKSCAIVRSVGS